MDILFTLLPVVVVGGFFFLWIAMLIHEITHNVQNKMLWVILLIVANVISAPFYYFLVYRKVAKAKDRQLLRSVAIIGSIVIIAVALVASFARTNKDAASDLKDISFSKVVDYNLKGEIKRIEIKGDELIITKKGDTKPSLRSHKPQGTSLYDHGIDSRTVEINVRP